MTSRGAGISRQPSMTSKVYVEEVINDALPHFLAPLRVRADRCIFMQDNAATNRAHYTMDSMAEVGITTLDSWYLA
jgi:hypothetical protein